MNFLLMPGTVLKAGDLLLDLDLIPTFLRVSYSERVNGQIRYYTIRVKNGAVGSVQREPRKRKSVCLHGTLLPTPSTLNYHTSPHRMCTVSFLSHENPKVIPKPCMARSRPSSDS